MIKVEGRVLSIVEPVSGRSRAEGNGCVYEPEDETRVSLGDAGSCRVRPLESEEDGLGRR